MRLYGEGHLMMPSELVMGKLLLVRDRESMPATKRLCAAGITKLLTYR